MLNLKMYSRYPWIAAVILLSILVGNMCTANIVSPPHDAVIKWCGDFCLCPVNNDEKLLCMESHDFYETLNFNRRRIVGLHRAKFDPIATLKWCDSSECYCHKESGKSFECVKDREPLVSLLERAAQMAPAPPVTESDPSPTVLIAGFGGSIEGSGSADEEDDTDSSHRKRDMDEEDEERRNRRRQNRRNNRKGRKRNRQEDPVDYDVLPEDFEAYGGEDNQLHDPNSHLQPRHEAINANPMVTAMKPSTRRQPVTPPAIRPILSNNSPHHFHQNHHPQQIDSEHPSSSPHQRQPHLQESSHPDFQSQSSNPRQTDDNPVLEVPVQRKTVVGRVSEDLQQITEDVQQIRSDVVFNQRILLITVAVAGVAMLGVVTLALHACCSSQRSSQRRTRLTENGRHHDDSGHHPSSTVTKVNIDEAW